METVRNENWTKSAPLGIVVEVVVVVAVVGVVVVVVEVVVGLSLPLLQLKIRTCTYMPSYCQARVRSPKVKSKRTWADKIIPWANLPTTFNHKGVFW